MGLLKKNCRYIREENATVDDRDKAALHKKRHVAKPQDSSAVEMRVAASSLQRWPRNNGDRSRPLVLPLPSARDSRERQDYLRPHSISLYSLR